MDITKYEDRRIISVGITDRKQDPHDYIREETQLIVIELHAPNPNQYFNIKLIFPMTALKLAQTLSAAAKNILEPPE